MAIRKLGFDEAMARLKTQTHPSRTNYLAMYSTWFGGIVTDPGAMMVPVDDHMVHRGDAVFEAIKCVDRRIYALDRHLQRLQRSAEMIAMKPPVPFSEIRSICLETVRESGADTCLLRLFVSRGPGSFTPNPYDTISSQIYLVITSHKPLSADRYERGVSAKSSSIAVKEGFFATVKSCNYLPNVLMKKEAVDSGVDFTVSRDEAGHLAEGSTENFAIVSKSGDFLVPAFSRTLKGVTAVRAMELAEKHLAGGSLIKSVRNASIAESDVRDAREAMFLGTTLDCLPVTTFDGRTVGDGKAGPFCRALQSLIVEDMRTGPLVTAVE